MQLFYVGVDLRDDERSAKTWLIVATNREHAFELARDNGERPATIEQVHDIPNGRRPLPGVIGWVGARAAALN